MNPKNKIINKLFPDNKVITEWDENKQLKYVVLWQKKKQYKKQYIPFKEELDELKKYW